MNKESALGWFLMRKLKVYKISVALFLVMGILSSTIMAEACACGSACAHVLQPKTKAYLFFHMQCPFTGCRSCDLEKGKTLKSVSTAGQSPHAKIPCNAYILAASCDDSTNSSIFISFDSFESCVRLPDSPIYIKTRSLLC